MLVAYAAVVAVGIVVAVAHAVVAIVGAAVAVAQKKWIVVDAGLFVIAALVYPALAIFVVFRVTVRLSLAAAVVYLVML